MGPEVIVLLTAAALTGGTKTGRKASRDFIASAHKATGWRTPRKALHHYSGKAGTAAGKATAASTRTGRQTAAKAGQHATDTAARRWQQRVDSGGAAPLIWRARPQEPGSAEQDGGGQAPGAAAAPGEPDSDGTGRMYKAGDTPWKVVKVGTLGAGPGGLDFRGWVFRDPDLPDDAQVPTRSASVGGSGADLLHGHTLDELHKLAHGDACDCPVSTFVLDPGPIRINPAPPGDGAASGGTGPDAPATPGTPPAPAGAPAKGTPMAAGRHIINLEPPTTDGEFLESCTQLGDVLKALAEQISNWADGLGSLNLPKSVLSPLHQLTDGITDAATGAGRAAKAFEDEFEDARDVASRGMKITGQDAA